MRKGFLRTNRQPSARVVSWSIRRRRRKQNNQSQESKSGWSCSMWTALPTANSCQGARRSLSKSTKKLLQPMFRSVRGERRQLWQNKTRLLYNENASANNTLSIREFLVKKNATVQEQSSYSPDLARCDFFLFPVFKGIVKENRFEGMETIKGSYNDGAERHPRGILSAVGRGVVQNTEKGY